MIEESVFYANPDGRIFEAVFRAGKEIHPNCTPNEDLPSIKDYDIVETSFYRINSGIREGLPVVLEAVLNYSGTLFAYSLSLYTKAQCMCAYYAHLLEAGGRLDEICNNHGFSRVKSVEPEKPKAPEIVGVFCRGCDNFYDYASPDYIALDNKITCWSCASHYVKCKRGLVNALQVKLVKKLNNIRC